MKKNTFTEKPYMKHKVTFKITCLWLTILPIGGNTVDALACVPKDRVTGSVRDTVLIGPSILLLTPALEVDSVLGTH